MISQHKIIEFYTGFLPSIDMKHHRRTCTPILTPPAPSPPPPPGLSQCTSFGFPASYSELALLIYFTCGNTHVSVLLSHIIPPLPSPAESKSLFLYVSLLLRCICSHRSCLSKFHIYALIYSVFLFLTYFTLYNSFQFHPPQ